METLRNEIVDKLPSDVIHIKDGEMTQTQDVIHTKDGEMTQIQDVIHSKDDSDVDDV